MIKNVFAFLMAGIWISASEVIRNELLFKSLWLEKYKSIGLEFPSATVNGALWGIWSFIFAGIALYLSKKNGIVRNDCAAMDVRFPVNVDCYREP